MIQPRHTQHRSSNDNFARINSTRKKHHGINRITILAAPEETAVIKNKRFGGAPGVEPRTAAIKVLITS